jgi:N,N'-diacetyllegionaminate synthase
MNAGIIILCRLHSKRLPNKALLPLGNSTIIDKCVLNCLESNSAPVIVATSTNFQDDALASHICMFHKDCEVFRGSEIDVAQRMLDAADKYGWDTIVRVTGDSPFISFELIRHLFQCAQVFDYIYLTNACLGTKPEIMSVSALRKIISEFDSSKSEYLTYYFKNNPDMFHSISIDTPQGLCGDYRLNVDYPEDYELAKSIYKYVRNDNQCVSLPEVIEIVERYKLYNINKKCHPQYVSGKLFDEIMVATQNRRDR